MRQRIRDILLVAQPKTVAVESLHPVSMMTSVRGTIPAQGKNVAAKRKLNESLAESAIGHVGKLLREEAAKLGIPAVSVPPHGTSQTCPLCGDRHPSKRESQAMFRCRHCGLYAHADWTAAVIIRNRAYVRHCEWQSGFTPDVLTAPTGGESSHPAPSRDNRVSAWSSACSSRKAPRRVLTGTGSLAQGRSAVCKTVAQDAKSVTNSVSSGKHFRILCYN